VTLEVANAIREGRLDEAGDDVDRRPLGRQDEVDAGRTGELGDADDRLLDVTRGDHHQVRQLVDDDEQVGVRADDPLGARQRRDLAGLDGLVELVDVLEAERREVVVAGVHLTHDPLEGLGGLLGVGDDRRDEVRDALVGGQLDPLGVHEHETHLIGGGPHEDRGDHRVDEARLARAGGAGDEQVGHLREVGDDVAALDVLADAHHHRVLAGARHLAAQHVAEADLLAVGVRDLDADRGLAGDRAEDAHVGRGDGIRDVLGEGGDPLDLDAGAELDLVAGDRRATAEAGDLGVDLELVEHRRQRLDDGVVGCAACLVRAAGLEERVVGQGVGDVAGEGELLHPLGQRCRRRRLEGDLLHDRGARGCRGRGRRGRPGRAGGGGRCGRGPALPGAQALAGDGVDDGCLLERLVTRQGAVGFEVGAAAAPPWCRGSDLVGVVAVVAGEPVEGLAEALGHLVQRGGGDDEQPEQAQEQQQGNGAVDGDGCLERAGGEEADDAAGGTHAVSALGRRRDAGGDVGEPACREGQRRGADGRTGGRRVVLGCAQHPDAEQQEHDRHGIADLAERPGHDGVHDGAHGAGHPPPLAGRDDHGERDEQQAKAVATVLGLEVAARGTDLAGDRSGGARQPHPRGLHGAQGQGQATRAGGSASLAGAGRRPAGCGARRRSSAARGGGRTSRHGRRLRDGHTRHTCHTRHSHDIHARPRTALVVDLWAR
jgi:hypothetical protein